MSAVTAVSPASEPQAQLVNYQQMLATELAAKANQAAAQANQAVAQASAASSTLDIAV